MLSMSPPGLTLRLTEPKDHDNRAYGWQFIAQLSSLRAQRSNPDRPLDRFVAEPVLGRGFGAT
jgi:hypothetical protein